MYVSTLPSLDLDCPQAKTKLSKHDHGFMECSVDKQNTDKKHHIINTQVMIDSNFLLYNLTCNEQRESQ
jgi:hypothetical protein